MSGRRLGAWAIVATLALIIAGGFLATMYALAGWWGVVLAVGAFALVGAFFWAISELVDH